MLSLPETKLPFSSASTSRWQQTVSVHFRVSMTIAHYVCNVVLYKLAEMKPISYQLLLS